MPIEDFDRLLRYDALQEAENSTGKSYKEDDATARLGFSLHMIHSACKREVLKAQNDTYYGMPLNEFMPIIKELKFEIILDIKNPNGKDHFCICWYDGVLLVFDTFTYEYNNETVVNHCSVYYNWLPNTFQIENDKLSKYDFVSSGGWEPLPDSQECINIGYADGREGLKSRLLKMRKYGTFLPTWQKRPHLWFVPHWEQAHGNQIDKSAYYESININKCNTLPQEIQKKLGGCYDNA